MRKLVAVSIGLLLLSAAADAALKQERITGFIKSIDSKARRITLDDGATFPLKPSAEVSWLEPGTKVDLICDYDNEVVTGCGVAIPELPKDINQEGPEDPLAGPGTGFSNETGYQEPDLVLPDKPSNNFLDLIRRRDR
jgi:hypothetical protein